MSVGIAHGALAVVGIYLAIGILVAVPFVASGVSRIDPAAKTVPWTFRILILPGTVALWPLMARLWIKAQSSS